jgi:hypothetical protein
MRLMQSSTGSTAHVSHIVRLTVLSFADGGTECVKDPLVGRFLCERQPLLPMACFEVVAMLFHDTVFEYTIR